MEASEEGLFKFSQLLRSFSCELVPIDLFVRACEPKATWSSTGEIIERLPLQAGVPEWLVDFYNANRPFFQGKVSEAHHSYFEISIKASVAYFRVTNEGQPDLEPGQDMSIINERVVSLERLAITFQAFPSINTEIIGEEMSDRFMDVVKTSILPLLSGITDADIEDWFLPRNLKAREGYLLSLFELLYQVVDILGVDYPALPLSLPRWILSLVTAETLNSCGALFSEISEVFDAVQNSSHMPLELGFLSAQSNTDERSNAMVGYILSMFLSNEVVTAGDRTSDNRLAEAFSNWQPLSRINPSSMECLGATSFCSLTKLGAIQIPLTAALDTKALHGLLLARRKQYKEATKILESTTKDIISQYGQTSMQLGIVIAELANCYNILRQEEKAEVCLKTTLESRKGSSLMLRRDGTYLSLALADSFIGRARYNEALPILQRIIEAFDISATSRMMSALRLAKCRRRMRRNPHEAFEQDSPLWAGFALLADVPGFLTTEYIEELACSISEMSRVQVGQSENVLQLIEAVNRVVGKVSSLTNSPSWEWYTELQEEYSVQVASHTKPGKGKQKEEGANIKEMDDDGSPSAPSPSLDLDFDIVNNAEPWSEQLVLALDGAGVCALSSLLILKRLMRRIRQLEIVHPDGPAYLSRSYLGMRHREHNMDMLKEVLDSDRVDEFLPCHYFDYIAGTSIGGLNSIMLGRLRMSADEAIDGFIHFANAVFGHPRVFHAAPTFFPLRTKYSSSKASEAFKQIMISSKRNGMKGRFTPEIETLKDRYFTEDQTFKDGGRYPRTFVISTFAEGGPARPYMWSSHGVPDGELGTNSSAAIWQVACAISARPLHFDPIEIGGIKYIDGDLKVSHFLALTLDQVNVYAQHEKVPSVLLSIGAGIQVEIEEAFGPGAEEFIRLGLQSYSKAYQNLKTYAKRTTNTKAKYAESTKPEQAYRLDAGENLLEFPFDDWRPVNNGNSTIQEITDITDTYLRQGKVRDSINSIAKEAVRIRRARAKTKQWVAFATDVVPVCPLCRLSK